MAVPGTGIKDLQLVLGQNPKKRGLAIIVCNSYSKLPDEVLNTLKGTHHDGERMKGVFEKLEIATVLIKDANADTLFQLLEDLSRTPKQLFPSSYKSISFVFSGHGQESGEICMDDGTPIHLQEFVNFLLPQQTQQLGNIPKLFFIDACRGSQKIIPVLCPRSRGGTERREAGEVEVLRRGGTERDAVLIPPDGNTLLAWSTTHANLAHENETGGIWMNTLAEKLCTSRKEVEAVLTEVRQELHQRYQQHMVWKDHMQMPETISKLLQPVYLHPDAEREHYKHAAEEKSPEIARNLMQYPVVPPVTNPNPSDPGLITQRHASHPGHYKGRLLHLVQTNVISDVKDTFSPAGIGFVCTLTLNRLAGGGIVPCQFKGDARPSKAEAKESAAQKAVQFLGGSSPPQPGAGHTQHLYSNGVSTTVNPIPRPPVSSPITRPIAGPTVRPATSPTLSHRATNKDPISILKEYCEQNKLKEPLYNDKMIPLNGENCFVVQVTVRGRVFRGEAEMNKKAAKRNAAKLALASLSIQ